MTEGAPRRVTRGYAAALTFASVMVATALIVALWGLIAVILGRDPVEAAVGFWVAPLLVVLILGMLAVGLWQQAIVLLKGRRAPAWGIIVSVMGGAYLVWCLLGVALGMGFSDTWLSPFAAVLVVACGVAALLFWAVLARRVYTDRPPPRWPWERDGENE